MCTLQAARSLDVTWKAQADALQMLGLQCVFVPLAMFRRVSRNASYTSHSSSIAPTYRSRAVRSIIPTTKRKHMLIQQLAKSLPERCSEGIFSDVRGRGSGRGAGRGETGCLGGGGGRCSIFRVKIRLRLVAFRFSQF